MSHSDLAGSKSVVSPKLIIALDFASEAECLALVQQLDPSLCRLKVGKEMFTLFGPALVEKLQRAGFDVFLDLKFHDIPNTVAKAVSAAASLGVWMVNVHASGGERMMSAAKEALANCRQPPLLIAVTVLTSMNEDDIRGVGVVQTPQKQVELLAGLSKKSGLDGVVCSAMEVVGIKNVCGHGFLAITPGIRPLGAAQGDQRRVLTPEQAIQNGSDYLVVGRPITQSENPLVTLKAMAESIV